MRLAWVAVLAWGLLDGQTVELGKKQFESRCAVCHGGDGMGGELGPGIIGRIANRTDAEIMATVREGLPTRGMPAFVLKTAEMDDLVGFLRTLRRPRNIGPPVRKSVVTTDGKTFTGLVENQSQIDLQLRTDEGRVHLLRPVGGRFREVTSTVDWPTYNGDVRGNRYTPLKQISQANVSQLSPQWMFTMEGVARAETTPVVVEGLMYVTSANECWALDAGSGREIWHFQRPKTRGLVGNAAGGFNRGVAWAGDRVFMVTDNAHILALNRISGAIEWETEMADWKQNYNATSAPLAVGRYVVSGTAGGKQGARGFIAAYDQATGKEAWRFWTVPQRGEPGSETWLGKGIDHPSAVAWFTGTFDPATNTLYWPTGNPGPDLNDEDRGGDNLYACSILALDAATGKLKWHYQFTPHDIFDWDATEPPVLIDTTWKGEPRKLLIQANRNGFFYVLDRTNGKLLSATPFVKKLNWAREIGGDGRPVLNQWEPAGGGLKICPSMDGASNWFSTSFNPSTGLYYVQTLEKCSIYVKSHVEWEAGRGYMGGSSRSIPDEVPQKVLRAIDVQTGKIAWEVPQLGPATSWGGTLATASGLVFVAEDSGLLMAVDASTGKSLWQFQTSQVWKASPMTYMFDGKQYIAIAAGQTILGFAVNQ